MPGLLYLSGNGHGSGYQEPPALNAGGHHGELAGVDELDEAFDLLGQAGVLQVLGRVRVGGLVARVGVGKRLLVRHFDSSF